MIGYMKIETNEDRELEAIIVNSRHERTESR